MVGFVLGTGRCGSTLLHELLCRHPSMAFVSNVEDRVPGLLGRATSRWNRTLYRRLPPAWTEKGRMRFAPSEAYRALAREVSPLLVDPPRDLVAADATPELADSLRAFVAYRQRMQHSDVFTHKLTGWPRVGLLDAVFPDARFVHVVRDGRAVAVSWLEMPWWRGSDGPDGWHWGPLPSDYAEEWERSGRDQLLLAGLGWKLLVDAFVVARQTIDDARWLEVRYEDLLDDAGAVMSRVVSHLGLTSTAEFELAVARYEVRPSAATRFRGALTPEKLDMLTASLADHLVRLGYDV